MTLGAYPGFGTSGFGASHGKLPIHSVINLEPAAAQNRPIAGKPGGVAALGQIDQLEPLRDVEKRLIRKT